jgi:hypothetical protein
MMPLVFAAAEMDSPEAKILYFTLPEGDAVNSATVITFGGCGLTNLNAAPTEVFVTEISPAVDAVTEACLFSVTATSALGFSVVKTSVSGGAATHTFAIYFHTRPFYG